MPIDPIMLDATLSTFRNMAQEIKEKGLEGDAVDEMNAALARMEQLGQELDDFTDYNGKVMTENLYGRFSDHYGKALSQEAQVAQEEKGYDDATLLKQTLDALRNAIKAIEQSKKDAVEEANKANAVEGAAMMRGMMVRGNLGIGMSAKKFKRIEKITGVNIDEEAAKADEDFDKNKEQQSNALEIDRDFQTELLTQPIQDLIDLGEQPGMILPRFLKIQIEKGLDKAAEGTAMSLDSIQHFYGWAKAQMISRPDLELKKAELDLFNEMIEKAPFNVPNTKKFNIYRKKLEHQFTSEYAQWYAVKDRWEAIIDTLEYWLIASSSVFPSYSPWVMIPDWETKKEIAEYMKDCNPGFLKVKLDNFKSYFDMEFQDIFKHGTFIWEVENYHLGYSQEYMEFLAGPVFEACKPLAKAPQELIDRFESHFHNQKRMGNPELYKSKKRIEEFYDNRYGEGRWAGKFGVIEIDESNTAPWDLSSFSV